MRRTLAKKHKADVSCPVATGFGIKTVAEAAFENYAAGQPLSDITPVWRVLDGEASIYKKVSFDAAVFIAQRQAEQLD